MVPLFEIDYEKFNFRVFYEGDVDVKIPKGSPVDPYAIAERIAISRIKRGALYETLESLCNEFQLDYPDECKNEIGFYWDGSKVSNVDGSWRIRYQL